MKPTPVNWPTRMFRGGITPKVVERMKAKATSPDSVVVNGSVLVSASDLVLVREALKMAVETLSETLQIAERNCGKGLVRTLTLYRDEVTALLGRLQ